MKYLAKLCFTTVLVLGFNISNLSAQSGCEPRYKTQTKLLQNNYYGECPCFNSAQELRDAIGDQSLPTSCMIDNTFGVLTGGPARFTTRDSGGVFNCFFENIKDNDQKRQIVEYDDNDRVYEMHKACNNIIKEFARNYGISCK